MFDLLSVFSIIIDPYTILDLSNMSFQPAMYMNRVAKSGHLGLDSLL